MPRDRRIRSCFNLLQRGSDKKRFQYCIGSEGLVVYLRAIQGHSGGTMVDLAVVDNVDMPYGWSEYFHHVGCSRCPSSRTNGSWKRCERRAAKSVLHQSGSKGLKPSDGNLERGSGVRSACSCRRCTCFGAFLDTPGDLDSVSRVKKNLGRKVEVHLRPGPTSTMWAMRRCG